MVEYLTVMSIVIAGGLAAYACARIFRRKDRSPTDPTIDQIAAFSLAERDNVDPAKYYVVLVNTDIGYQIAYGQGRLDPEILEFDSLEQATVAANEQSVDLEGEIFACIYRGKGDYLAIHNNGKEL